MIETMYADQTTADLIKIAEGSLRTHGQAQQANCSTGLVRELITRIRQEEAEVERLNEALGVFIVDYAALATGEES